MSPTDPNNFRESLLASQDLTPALRDDYRKELDALLYQTHTSRSALPGIALLLICLAVVAGEIWALLHYPHTPTFLTGAITMLVTCAGAAAWLARDLYRGRFARKQSLKFPELFYGAASILLVAEMLKGLHAPADPASTFGVLFLYVFFAVCTNWSFSSRISAAELAMREQTLRLEYRLMTLSERLPSPTK